MEKILCSAIWNHKCKILNRSFQPKRASEGLQLVGSKSSVPDRPKSWSSCICPGPEASHQPHARRTAGRHTRTRSGNGTGSRFSREIVYSRSRKVALEFSQLVQSQIPVRLKTWAFASPTQPHPRGLKSPIMCGRPRQLSNTDTAVCFAVCAYVPKKFFRTA